MNNRGFNQIDLAVALSIMVGLMAFVIIYSTSILTSQISTVQTTELRSVAQTMGDIVFSDRGIPTDWPYATEAVRPSLMEYIYMVPVSVLETNGSSWTNVVVSVNVTTGEHAFNRSIRVYEGNKSLETYIAQSTDADGDGLLDSMNVTFKFDIGARQRKIVRIFYSTDNTTNATYATLAPTANTTLNITVLGERRLEGLTPLKLDSIHGRDLDYLKPRYGVERSFRIEVQNTTSPYAAGGAVPTATSVAVYERSLLSQNKSAHVNIVKATIWVW